MSAGAFLSAPEWADVHRAREGLIPVAVDAERARVIWQDIGRYHFYESFFHKSLAMCEALTGSARARFETSLDLLGAGQFAGEAVPLAGMIFHAGRSRSTLLARALARSRENLVLSEAAPVNALLAAHREWSDGHAAHLFRNLILAMCRRRVATHRRAFIKFTSHNIGAFALIRAAFPGVPAIFLSRDAVEIVASFRRSPPAWDPGDIETAVRRNIGDAASAGEDLPHVDHQRVTAEGLPAMLAHFRYAPDPAELALMRTRFDFDAKSDFREQPYSAQTGSRAASD